VAIGRSSIGKGAILDVGRVGRSVNMSRQRMQSFYHKVVDLKRANEPGYDQVEISRKVPGNYLSSEIPIAMKTKQSEVLNKGGPDA